jgi:hypothetical protein
MSPKNLIMKTVVLLGFLVVAALFLTCKKNVNPSHIWDVLEVSASRALLIYYRVL